MSAATWEWILALGFGSAVGVAIRRGLRWLFGQSGESISVSTVTACSILGGFSGAVIGYVTASPDLSKQLQTLVMLGLLGLMGTVSADATAAQGSLNPESATRVRKRLGVHLAVGAAVALITIGVVRWTLNAFS